MNIDNNILVDNKINNNIINEITQKNFLQTTLGKTINTAVDIGIRTLLPDFIEDQVINIKNNLLEYGLKEGFSKTINDAVDYGKSAIGIVTGNFENVSQMRNAIQKGGIIDEVSNLIDIVVNKTKSAGIINNAVATTIKNGKNVILDNLEKNIEKEFSKQLINLENANKYIYNWEVAYENKNFDDMEKEYKKIENQKNKLAPIEKTFDDIKIIENIHNLIKNNNKDFNLSESELELVKRLK